jgi:4-amino-4-deoxy-L-arabinose transferase-like glycosyltransferase
MIFKKNLIFFSLLLLFILLRTLLIFGSTNLFYEKELFTGAIAREILLGNISPIFTFLTLDYHYGQLISAPTTAAFFYIFGTNGLSLKFSALFFSGILLIAYFFFLKKHFQVNTAYLATVLLIFSCPIFARFNVINVSEYLGAPFFIPFIFALLFNFIFEKRECKSIRTIFFCGLVSGVGAWLFYANFAIVFMIIAVLLFFLDDEIRDKLKYFLGYISGLFIGLLPLLYFNLFNHLAGFSYKTKNGELFFSPVPLKEIALNIKNLFFFHLPLFYNFSDQNLVINNLFSYGYYLIFLWAFLYLLFKKRQRPLNPSIPFLLLFIIFTAILVVTHFTGNISPSRGFTGYRYLLNIYTTEIVIIAIALQNLRQRLIKTALISFLVITGLYGFFQDFSYVKLKQGNYRFYRGYSYERLGFHFSEQLWGLNKEKLFTLLNEMDIQHRGLVYQGLGWETVSRITNRGLRELSISQSVPSKYFNDFVVGLGRWSPHEVKSNPQLIQTIASHLPEDKLPYYYFGLGQRDFLTFQDKIKEWTDFAERNDIATTYLPDYYRGIGFAIEKSFGYDPTLITQIVGTIPKDHRQDCEIGLKESSKH